MKERSEETGKPLEALFRDVPPEEELWWENLDAVEMWRTAQALNCSLFDVLAFHRLSRSDAERIVRRVIVLAGESAALDREESDTRRAGGDPRLDRSRRAASPHQHRTR